jgi:hypothetical protein
MDCPQVDDIDQNSGRTLTTSSHDCFPEIIDVEGKPELRAVMQEVV